MKIQNIKTRFQQFVLANVSLVLLAATGVVGMAPTVSAEQTNPSTCNKDNVTLVGGTKCAQPTGVASNLEGNQGIFATVANILLFLVGAVAVIMLIIGGLRYVTSNGDQNAVTGAKNTIMYAIIGIVIAFLAYAGVNFVVNQLSAGTGGTTTN